MKKVLKRPFKYDVMLQEIKIHLWSIIQTMTPKGGASWMCLDYNLKSHRRACSGVTRCLHFNETHWITLTRGTNRVGGGGQQEQSERQREGHGHISSGRAGQPPGQPPAFEARASWCRQHAGCPVCVRAHTHSQSKTHTWSWTSSRSGPLSGTVMSPARGVTLDSTFTPIFKSSPRAPHTRMRASWPDGAS